MSKAEKLARRHGFVLHRSTQPYRTRVRITREQQGKSQAPTIAYCGSEYDAQLWLEGYDAAKSGR